MLSREPSISEIVDEIVVRNEKIRAFWRASHGWAPRDAADLLEKSRLDWQVSLSHCLRLWLDDTGGEDTEGRLILAWANLGSLVEGTMKFFLSVFYDDYSNDPVTSKREGKKKAVDPDGLTLEALRQFYKKQSIMCGESSAWDAWLSHIQQRRNAIHAYKDRGIGTFDEYFADVRKYWDLLDELEGRVPYPDHIY